MLFHEIDDALAEGYDLKCKIHRAEGCVNKMEYAHETALKLKGYIKKRSLRVWAYVCVFVGYSLLIQ
jgi:hypothetical protein